MPAPAGRAVPVTTLDGGVSFDIDYTGFAKRTAWAGAGAISHLKCNTH